MRLRLNKNTLKTTIGLLAVLALLLAGALLLRVWEEGRPTADSYERTDMPPQAEADGQELVYYDGEWYTPGKNLEVILFLGLDRSAQDASIPTHGNYAQTDAVLLLAVDRDSKICKAVQLNRDTIVEIQDFDSSGNPSGTYAAQLTLAYAHAQAYTGNDRTAARAAMDAVSKLLYGVEIDHYVTLTMDGLVILNDMVGGVEVEIRDDFSAVDSTLVQGETVTLLGQHALNYVRTRWWVGDSTNLERMERQRQYLEALQDKLTSLANQDEEFILTSLLAANEYMTSDCTVEQLAELAETVCSCETGGLITPEGEAAMAEEYVEFHPDEEALRKLVIECFYERAEKA